MKTVITLLTTLVAVAVMVIAGPPARGQEVIEGARDDDGFEIVYKISEPEITLLPDGYTSVELAGEGFQKYFGPAGSPVLPVRSVRALLPPDREIREVEVIPGERVAIEGTHQVEFARAPRPVSAPPPETDDESPDPAIYRSDRAYPGRLGAGHSIQYLRGYPILTMLLYPVEYIPAEGKLFYYRSLTLRVSHGPEVRPMTEETRKIMPRRDLPSDRQRVRGVVDNPGAMF